MSQTPALHNHVSTKELVNINTSNAFRKTGLQQTLWIPPELAVQTR